MIFIVAFIDLLIERFFDWSHLRHWQWSKSYLRAVMRRIPFASPYIVLAVSFIPLLMVVVLIDFLLKGFLYGLLALIFELFFLLYCLGPQNLWADTFACLNAITTSDAAAARDKVKVTFAVPLEEENAAQRKNFIAELFTAANQRIFTVLFWFAIFGPMGALLYRLIATSAVSEGQQEEKVNQAAFLVKQILEWLPIRFFAFLFALSGHFAQVYQAYRRYFSLRLQQNDVLLREAGLAGIGYDDEKSKLEVDANQAINLIDRSLVIALVLILIMVLLLP